MISICYFARYREAVGIDKELIDYDDCMSTIGALRDFLVKKGENWKVLNEDELMCAKNHELCSLETLLNDGDEVAFFPTVTGG